VLRRQTAGAALAATLFLAACTGNGELSDNRAAGRFRPATPGVLKVATTQVPAAGFWEGTAARPTGGFEWGLAQAIADRLGLQRIEVEEVPFQELVAGHLDGADIALSQLTPSEARERVLDFSEPYLPAKPAVLVRAGTRVDDVAAARGLRWSVRRRSTLERLLHETVRPDKPVQSVDTRQESLDALRNREVDAVLLDLPVATAIASMSGGRFKVAAQFASDDSLAVALPHNRAKKEVMDSVVRALSADGTLRRLADRWLGVALTGSGAENVPLIQVAS
jgi:polar amino acid transport system substrate-binding protein